MPTYEYRCSACEHAWEEFESITAKPLRKCPDCGKSKARRMISAGGGIIFKGSGFYQTDYRSESYKKGASAEKSAKESSTTSSDSTKPSASDSGASKTDSGSKSTASSE